MGAHDEARCHTLSLDGSVVVPYLIQGILGIACLATLMIKRHLEKPQRPIHIWAADVSKQVVAALAMHALNILFAVWLKAASKDLQSDECAWYVVNISVDTVLGVFMGYFMLRLLERTASKRGWHRLEVSGDYGDPIDKITWLSQLGAWIVIVAAYKLMLILLIFIFLEPLAVISWGVMAPLRPYPALELTVVMIITPLVMNAWQFWVTDTFIMFIKDDSSEGEHGTKSSRMPCTCCCRRLFVSQSNDEIDRGVPGNARMTTSRGYSQI